MELPISGKWNFHLMNGIHKGKDFDSKVTLKGQAKYDAALDHLAIMQKKNWARPHASPIKNNKYVIRFRDENTKQHRLFGHFFDEHEVFVITIAGYEKGNAYYPKDYNNKCELHKSKCDANFINTTKPITDRCGICNGAEGLKFSNLYNKPTT